jgi:ABC-type multidrug transport system ATPase subunit
MLTVLSGCGKTTLLNVLAHRETSGSTVQQSRLLNGNPISLQEFRRISCYVEQEDALMGVLTVRETLYFAAKLSLPSSVGKVERMNRIEALITAFGLNSAANVLVGTPIRKGISGGQKRRLSVASQLIISPKILFLDEPTSGLDSSASYEVMSFVKNIAAKYHVRLLFAASCLLMETAPGHRKHPSALDGHLHALRQTPATVSWLYRLQRRCCPSSVILVSTWI